MPPFTRRVPQVTQPSVSGMWVAVLALGAFRATSPAAVGAGGVSERGETPGSVPAKGAVAADESGAAEADGAVSASGIAVTKGSAAATDWATGSGALSSAASSGVVPSEPDAARSSRGEAEGL